MGKPNFHPAKPITVWCCALDEAKRKGYGLGMNATMNGPVPDALGHFGPYGGRYVPETLMHPLQEMEEGDQRAPKDPAFQQEVEYYLREFCGRPTPLYFAGRLTRELGGGEIYLTSEGRVHTCGPQT